MEEKCIQWWGITMEKILHIAKAEKDNDQVQAILELAGQEITNGMYVLHKYIVQ